MPYASPPLERGVISSPYGADRSPKPPHKGVDLAAPFGTPVHAILPGRVIAVLTNGQATGYGNLIVIKHGDDAYSLYAHLDQMYVEKAKIVYAGEIIGTVGDTAGTTENPTAKTTGPHLHLETLTQWPPNGRYVDRVNPQTILADLGSHLIGPPLIERIDQRPITLPPPSATSLNPSLIPFAALFVMYLLRR